MTKFYNVCSRSENPNTKKVNWLKFGTVIQKDDEKMYLKLNMLPDQLFHCFLNEPKQQNLQASQLTKPVQTSKQAIKQAIKVGRNDLCPCGSGKKYKKCCA